MKSSGILIANRGEISVRIARAAAELGIRSVSIYSEEEKNRLHTKISNEAALIPGMGAKAYLDIDSIILTAKKIVILQITGKWDEAGENAHR